MSLKNCHRTKDYTDHNDKNEKLKNKKVKTPEKNIESKIGPSDDVVSRI